VTLNTIKPNQCTIPSYVVSSLYSLICISLVWFIHLLIKLPQTLKWKI